MRVILSKVAVWGQSRKSFPLKDLQTLFCWQFLRLSGTRVVNGEGRDADGLCLWIGFTMHTNLTVLLANESEGWHKTVQALLEPQGVRTLSVRTGREALSHIEAGDCHVAVLDMNMPQLGGMQVVKLSRELPKPPPAILLAEHLTNQLLQEALSMHVFSVLPKPVDFNLLLDSLARAIKRHYEGRWPN